MGGSPCIRGRQFRTDGLHRVRATESACGPLRTIVVRVLARRSVGRGRRYPPGAHGGAVSASLRLHCGARPGVASHDALSPGTNSPVDCSCLVKARASGPGRRGVGAKRRPPRRSAAAACPPPPLPRRPLHQNANNDRPQWAEIRLWSTMATRRSRRPFARPRPRLIAVSYAAPITFIRCIASARERMRTTLDARPIVGDEVLHRPPVLLLRLRRRGQRGAGRFADRRMEGAACRPAA